MQKHIAEEGESVKMSFQSLIMSNLKLANLFMSRMPAQFWANQAEKKALALFRIAAERIPAYRDFLKKNQVDIRSIKSIDDFKELPVI
ncbi:MAG: hypothetical protein KAR20_28370, partial [Candidatus Heimdallarchaeota archaeon]|nr:hypothetical protein [Candidatus Heimdallarchaeota archaeon]